ncbi:MAG: type transporter [Acidimicrobiales bacterium]|jgi:ABC-2 type transport system permease protein|nr:type transporter [Acidimicrobiales bacterium]
MTTTTPASATDPSRPMVAKIRLPEGGAAQDLRAVKVVWQREMIRFSQDRIRIVTALVQPILYVFVLGTGLSSLTKGATGDVSLRTFMFPGVLALSVLFTAMFSAVSIVWDREFGFLREMLVAPVRRSAIILGKCLGGATVAAIQGLIVLALAGLVSVPYSPIMLATLAVEMLLLGFTVTAFGLVIAARIKQMQAMMGLMQMILMPLMFLSGVLYPLAGLPRWLNVLVHINPITYAVHPLRLVVFAHIHASATAVARLNPPLTWWGWPVPTLVQLAVVAATGMVFLWVAVLEFDRAD